MPSRSGSTPIIWNDTIFLNVATGRRGRARAVGVDRATGACCGSGRSAAATTSSASRTCRRLRRSPTARTVWVMTGTGILKAFDFSGTELWMRDIQKDYGRSACNWGYASSPLLHEDALYVQVLHGMKTDDPSYLMRHRQGRPARRCGRSNGRPTRSGIAGRVHHAGAAQERRRDGDRDHRRRRGDRSRPGDRQGTVARRTD